MGQKQYLSKIINNDFIKLTSLGFLMFVILINQNILRAIKDGFIVNAMGAEAISFIRLWIELPFSLAFALLYTKLCNIMSTEKIFRYIILFCLIFFGLFGFIIYPNLDLFHPSQTTITLYSGYLPVNFYWFIIIWSNWLLAIFYVVADLWPAIVYSLLFWQLANKITSLKDSTKLYPILSFIGQSNLLFAGPLLIYFSSNSHFLSILFPNIANPSELTLKSFTLLMLISGFIALLIQIYIEKNIVAVDNYSKQNNMSMGIIKSIRSIINSKYLCKIFILIISYNIMVVLIDGLWMNQARKFYTTSAELIAYQGKVFFYTGVFSIFSALLGNVTLKKYGWYKTALITPLIFALSGTMFFSFVIINTNFTQFTKNIANPISLILLFGGLQNIFAKGIKYAIFDPTKEMAYIPLNAELKTKGKAVVDVFGVQIGRLAGSGLEFLLLMLMPGKGYDQIAGVLFFSFIIINATWIITLISLSKDYKELANNNKTITNLY